jgi:dienelactone hydrolase
MRSVADWYAAHGFVALCPDLFWRLERGVELTDKGEDRNKASRFTSDLTKRKRWKTLRPRSSFYESTPRAVDASARLVFAWAAISRTCCQCVSNLIVRLDTTASVSKRALDEART